MIYGMPDLQKHTDIAAKMGGGEAKTVSPCFTS